MSSQQLTSVVDGLIEETESNRKNWIQEPRSKYNHIIVNSHLIFKLYSTKISDHDKVLLVTTKQYDEAYNSDIIDIELIFINQKTPTMPFESILEISPGDVDLSKLSKLYKLVSRSNEDTKNLLDDLLKKIKK